MNPIVLVCAFAIVSAALMWLLLLWSLSEHRRLEVELLEAQRNLDDARRN
jgi:hypothetical protein